MLKGMEIHSNGCQALVSVLLSDPPAVTGPSMAALCLSSRALLACHARPAFGPKTVRPAQLVQLVGVPWTSVLVTCRSSTLLFDPPSWCRAVDRGHHGTWDV